MNRLNWEINNRTKWNEDVARTSLASRAFTLFMGCFACQTFWTAAAVFAVTRGVAAAGWFFSAAAYSGAAVLLSMLYGSRLQQAAAATGRTPGCKNRGK